MWPFTSRKADGITLLQFTSSLHDVEQTILTELRSQQAAATTLSDRLRTVEQTLSSQTRLLQSVQQLPGGIDALEQHLNDLAVLVNQLSTISGSGQHKPVREQIQARIAAALAAITALGSDQETWLDEQIRMLNNTQQALAEARRLHDLSLTHISPPEEDRHTDSIPVAH
jgi:vacuolar-type H+-ATPase subunit I/STV1